MTTQHQIGLYGAPFIADKDLTAKQYYFVMSTSTPNNVDVATGASNPGPIGVLQNSPSAGAEAEVWLFGPTKVVGITATCLLKVGKYITCSSAGQAETATCITTGAWGKWISASVTSGSVFGEILLWPAATCTNDAS